MWRHKTFKESFPLGFLWFVMLLFESLLTKPYQRSDSKIREIDRSYLRMQQFDEFWICNHQKWKLHKSDDTFLEKNREITSIWSNELSFGRVFFSFVNFVRFCLKTNVVWMSQHESNRKASFCLKYVVALKPMCMADNSSHPTIFLDLRTTTTDWSFRATMLYMALETLLSLTYFSAFEIQIVDPFRNSPSWFLAIPWITS